MKTNKKEKSLLCIKPLQQNEVRLSSGIILLLNDHGQLSYTLRKLLGVSLR